MDGTLTRVAPSDMTAAILNPAMSFDDDDLRHGTPHRKGNGQIWVNSGSFGHVYRVVSGDGARSWAVKCFAGTAPSAWTYRQIKWATGRLPYMVACDYLPTGIRVRPSGSEVTMRRPILKMAWVQGTTLDRYVEGKLRDRQALVAVAQRFLSMMQDLAGRRVAHGDLQHGNVLVLDDGSLRLVDYDGMWLPSFRELPIGRRAREGGHPHFQHPGRGAYFGSALDHFPAWVVYTSLVVAAAEPDLWDPDADHGDDRLFFSRADFDNPSRAGSTFARLSEVRNVEAARLVAYLRSLLDRPFEEVPALTGGTLARVKSQPSEIERRRGALRGRADGVRARWEARIEAEVGITRFALDALQDPTHPGRRGWDGWDTPAGREALTPSVVKQLNAYGGAIAALGRTPADTNRIAELERGRNKMLAEHIAEVRSRLVKKERWLREQAEWEVRLLYAENGL